MTCAPHFWDIELQKHYPFQQVGVCRHCGETRAFTNTLLRAILPPGFAWKDPLKPGKGKRRVSVG